MKTDRELLELAAKAEGITLHAVGNGDGEVVFYTYPDMLFWNPLTDDGDALRLAVKLGLTVCMDGLISVSAGYFSNEIATQLFKEGGDKYFATRRAIVRAAAAIGEAM